MIRQRTIRKEICTTGVGLHSGNRVYMNLKPAPINTGVVFIRNDLSPKTIIKADASLVHDTLLCTALVGDNGVRVSTIEHLSAALSALGIDNIFVELDSSEVPVMDGSSHPFLYLLISAGIKEQKALKKFIKIKETVRVEDDDKWAELSPAIWGKPGFRLSLEIDFDQPAISRTNQSVSIELTANNFAKNISRARTFGFMKDIEMLRAKNLALGGTLDNAVVIDDYKVINPDGLRFDDEFVRHKMLDAIGDLYMSGSSIIGSFNAYKTGHHLNNKLIRCLLENKTAWEYVEFGGGDESSDIYSIESTLILA
ncbi:UDP-3-O-acyl-N-acetylglucosamine deacetylase [Aeromonas media]|uniref:UDP-3-O-acyl-N-acetylglucosamine deacetylase n=1 Tax=Aeromonas media TaxID=651 RepID=UPI003D1B99B2